MAFKLYGSAASPYCGTVILTAYEKEVEFELELVELRRGEHKAPDYLAKQPFGKIPYIQDGDLTLFESRAIARYLAEKYAGQGTDLYPKELAQRAAVEQWIEVQGQNFEPPMFAIAIQRWGLPLFFKVPADEAVIAENFKKLEAVLDVYEAHLSKSKYLAGDLFSLADLSHIAMTNFFLYACPDEYAKLFPPRKHVQEWWDDVQSRPSFKKYKNGADEYMTWVLETFCKTA